MDQIGEQIKAAAGLLGAAVTAWVGLWARHATDPNGFSWKKLLTETPVALMCGIIAAAIGTFVGLQTLVVWGLSSFAAYISPPIFFSIVRSYVERRNGKAD